MPPGPLRPLEPDLISSDLDSNHDLDSPDAETPLLHGPRDEHPPRQLHYVSVVATLLCAALLIDIGDFMQQAPLTRILEDILCRKYYESTQPLGAHISFPIPEQECKIPAVQGQLAMLRGWDSALSCIPTLLLALPYGYVADRYGRKIVLVLGLLGVTIGFAWSLIIVQLDSVLNVRWIWAGNAFLCIGGGPSVIRAAVYAMLTDVTPEGKRAAVFFQFAAATMLNPLLGAPLAWHLMKQSPFLAMAVGVGFISVGLIITLFLPETLNRTKLSGALSHASNSEVSPEDEGLSKSSKPLSIFGVFKGSTFVFATPTLRMLSITFITSPVSTISMSFIVQFTSGRYHWGIADSSFIAPFSAIATFLMLAVILPLLYSLLDTRLGMHPAMRDLVVARGSLIFSVLGFLAIALAPVPGLLVAGTGIASLGSGFMPAIRSLITSFVQAGQVSRLYGVLAIIETLGALFLSPLISKSFSWGMDLGGTWSGMSFIVAGVMTLVLGIPVWIIRSPKPEEDVHG